MTATDEDLGVAVATWGLPGAAVPFPSAPLPDERWQALSAAVRKARISGLFAGAVAGGAMPVTPAQRQDVAALHAQAMAVTVVLDRLLIELSTRLGDAEVDHRVLKGAAVAHTTYPDPSWRQYGDVDLLVPSAHYDRALAVLAAAGCERSRPQLRPGFDRRFGKGTTLRSADGHWVDVHRTLVMGPFGLSIRTDDLFTDATPFTVAGHTVQGLGRDLRFLHACYNAALGDTHPRLLALRDIAEMVLHDAVDTEAALSLAAAWEGRVVVARAVQLTWERLRIADRVPLSEWAGRYRPSRSEARALLRHLGAGRRYARTALASLRAISGLRAKAGYLYALALPSRAFLDERDLGPVQWLRKGRDSVLRNGASR